MWVVQAVASFPSEQPAAIIFMPFSGFHSIGTILATGRMRPGRMRSRATLELIEVEFQCLAPRPIDHVDLRGPHAV